MDPKSAPVELRNTMRRPLTFRVGGKTVRLSPGERMNVPESWLGSAELQHFCRAGHVAAESAPPPEPAARREPGEEDADEESKREKTRKPKPTKHGD
jgi:hypothetical protein